MLIPLFVNLYYHKRTLCYILLISIQTVCFLASFIVVIHYDYKPSLISVPDHFFGYFYAKPYCRIGPFFIGLLTAFCLYSIRYDNPETSFFRRIGDRINSSTCFRFFLYITGAGLVLFCSLMEHPINKDDKFLSKWAGYFWLIFSRSIYILGVSMFLMPMFNMHGTPLRKVLAADFWVPFARVSFGVYMLHEIFMEFHAYNAPISYLHSHSTVLVSIFAWFMIVYLASFLFTVFVETPFNNCEKEFLMGGGGGKKKKPADETPDEEKPKFSINSEEIKEEQDEAKVGLLSADGNK